MSGLKITIFSADIDVHHTELFFYNYFRLLAGTGAVTWRTLPYEGATPGDVAASDLVVFVRPRFLEVPALLQACRAQGIPSLVTLDDNWIAAGKEYSRFAALFTPGKPSFEIFIDSLQRADAVLVFSRVLEEEIQPWANEIFCMSPNVDLSRFASRTASRASGFVVGFAGSTRFENTGFQGLRRFLFRHPHVRLLIISHEVPEPLQDVSRDRVMFIPWLHDYDTYAQTLATIRPDVLIAPLDVSRFSASKVPIKFLNSAAVGAAGIYSRVSPYAEHVRNRETGLLVENRVEAWEAALDRLHDDDELRHRIIVGAAAVVRESFTTERLLPDFLNVLHRVAKRAEN